ncbi:MAG: AmmeMemoRadiSam system protein A [Sulfuricurvum sp.]
MDQKGYVALAKDAIRAAFEQTVLDKDHYTAKNPRLEDQGAAFVTLTEQGRLRGCIGSIIAHRSLYDDIVHNARSAAFRDPRFLPLAREEFQHVDVEVSLLTPPQEVLYADRHELEHLVRPGIDGVILKLNGYQATFLPQVWEELNDFDSFFSHLGIKAGIGNNPLDHHPQIFTYQVEKFS